MEYKFKPIDFTNDIQVEKMVYLLCKILYTEIYVKKEVVDGLSQEEKDMLELMAFNIKDLK